MTETAEDSQPEQTERRSRGRPRLHERAKYIAQRIAQARIQAQKSAEEVAYVLELSKTQYKHLELRCDPKHGETRLPRLADLFGVSVEWFTEGFKETRDTRSVPTIEAPTVAQPLEIRLDAAEAQRLGARARARREELGLSRNEISEYMNMPSAMVLRAYEISLPRKRRPVEDKWEEMLQVPKGWLRNPDLEAFPAPAFSLLDGERTVAHEITAICTWFARKSPFRRTIDCNALDPLERRMMEIMRRRFGILGEESSTLQSIGDQLGITRERVRQINEDFVANLGELEIKMPALDRLRSEIQVNLPCKVGDLDRIHRELLGESLSIMAADRFAREVLGSSVIKTLITPPNFTIMAVADDASYSDDLKTVRQVTLAMIRVSGAAQVHFIAGMSSSLLKRGVMPDDVIRFCRYFSTFEWLSEEDGWFWLGSANENRAKTVTLKVLSVADRNVDIEEIRDAMSRARLIRYDPDKTRPFMVDAPISILKEIITRIPGIETLQFNDFRLEDPLPPEKVLSDSELTLLRVLKRHGGAATRQVLVEEALTELDVSSVAINVAIDSSPIFTRLDFGIWGIRGCRVDPKAIAAAIGHATSTGGGIRKFFTTHHEPVDGWWTVQVAVPESAFSRRCWFVPAAVADLLTPGPYTVDGFDEPVNYVININSSMGIVNRLIAVGIEPNEDFLLHIHASERRFRIEKLKA